MQPPHELAMQRTERIMSKAKSRTAKKASSRTAGAACPTSKLGQLQAMLQRPEGATRTSQCRSNESMRAKGIQD